MNSSWKTTLCGILGALCVGMSQIPELAPLWAKICALLGATFPNVGLLFARDNKVTSEQAGASSLNKPTLPSASKLLLLLLACGSLALAVPTLTGCKGTPQQIAFKTLSSVETTTTAAYDTYVSQVIAGTVPTNSLPTISRKFNLFQASFLIALDGVQYNTNALAPDSLTVLSGDLLNLIATASKK